MNCIHSTQKLTVDTSFKSNTSDDKSIDDNNSFNIIDKWGNFFTDTEIQNRIIVAACIRISFAIT